MSKNSTDIDVIWKFWFGELREDAAYMGERSAIWFGKNEALDEKIGTQFSERVRQAGAGELTAWKGSERGLLCLVIMLDQFSRNIWRETPQSFEHDALARTYCEEGVHKGFDLSLSVIERFFFYMPWLHSEKLTHQEKALSFLAERVIQPAPAALKSGFSVAHRSWVAHRDIIKRFGRFPHRNAILGRTSTPEEIAFLKEPGSSF